MGLSPRQTLDGQRLLRIPGLPIKICTWNVKTMYEAGKIHNAIKEMDRLSIDVMGISEMRWTDSGQCMIEDHKIYYSGSTTGQHINGVGIILNKSIAKYATNFTPISERIMVIQINSFHVKTNIIQVYAPTAEKSEEIIELFYDDLNKTLKNLCRGDITLIIGDFNAKIGQGECGEVIGSFGLGERNERGDRLCSFATEEQMVITNTFFKLPLRRLYTWKSPQDSSDHLVRNQIDYILINKRFRNSVTSVKTYPGADIKSDHNPLVATLKLKLKRIKRKKVKKYDLRQLKNEDTKNNVKQYIKSRITYTEMEPNIESNIKKLEETSQDIVDKFLQPKKVKKKSWMTDSILDMMESRRKAKDRDTTKYKQIDKEIKGSIRKAKSRWLEERCSEIEALENKYDSFNLHKKVKEAAGMYTPKIPGCMTDNQGHPIMDREQLKSHWKHYVENTFKDDRNRVSLNTECRTGPPIMYEEVKTAIKCTKDGKAAGPDNFYSEFLKLMDEEQIKWLTTIFNNIYNSGKIPRNWLKSTFIALPKKSNARKCDDYRIISLMSHLLKTFLKIIHKRVYRKCEEHITRTQFGFRDALGTREALFAVQVLFQRCRDVNCDIYVCFIDYQKAFDRVKHDKLMSILELVGLDDKDLRIIENIYFNQSAAVKIEDQLTEEIKIERGVRQGCVLSPLLFNVYSEYVMNLSLDDVDEGILINGERLNNIRYADDTIVFADSLEGLQSLITRIANFSKEYGLDFNIKKTKYMVISKNNIPPGQLLVNQQPVIRVSNYVYLGTNVNDRWDHSVEIRQRIEKARSAFTKMNNIFKSHSIPLKTKIRLLRCYVFTVLLYGVESWTLTEASTKKLEAFEMWCYRRILKISWVDRITNDAVLRRMGKEREIVNNVKKRKLEYLGHVMRNEQRYNLLQLILQGKIFGKRGPGRRRISWLQNLRKWFSLTTTGLFKAAVNKIRIAMLVANIRNE